MNGTPRAASAGGEAPPGGAGAPSGARAGARARRRATADERVGRVVFALLVLACGAAFLITQRLKHTPTAVQEFKRTDAIVPASSGALREERISFKLDEADEVTVTIESTAGEGVATLVRDLPAPRYKTVSLRWNGREGTAHGYTVLRLADGYTTLVPVNHGRIAPPGEYRARVSLRRQKRSVASEAFTLVGR